MMPNWGSRGRPTAEEFREQLAKDYGNKLVRLEHKKIRSDQSKMMRTLLEPSMMNMSYSSYFDRDVDSYVFLFPYDGNLNELEEVLVCERRIGMKSITIP